MPAIQVDSTLRMNYEDDYFGPPWRKPEAVVMVHGVAESSLAWQTWVPALSGQFRVLRIDQRGFGRSTIPPKDYPWSINSFAADLAHFLDALELDAVHVVAAKLGGTIALQFAADFPARVRSLSVVSSPVRALKLTSDPKLLEVTGQLARIGVRGWAEGTQRMRLGSLVSGEHISFWNDLMASSDYDVCVNVEEMAGHMDVTPALPRIKAPTLVMTMAGGAMQPPEAVLAWTRLIPDARVVTIAGDGYHPAASRPDECAAHVLAFIQACAAAKHNGPAPTVLGA